MLVPALIIYRWHLDAKWRRWIVKELGQALLNAQGKGWVNVQRPGHESSREAGAHHEQELVQPLTGVPAVNVGADSFAATKAEPEAGGEHELDQPLRRAIAERSID